MSKIRVYLVDDHGILREGIRSLLAREAEIELLGESETAEEGIERISALKPDVVLMDITLPGMNGLEATAIIKERNPQTKVLILTMHESEQYLSGMLKAGASGYVVKTTNSSELISAIKSISQGEMYLFPSMATMLVKDYLKKVDGNRQDEDDEELTGRELEILRYIAEDKKNREIAEILNISIRTVQTHRTNVMEKLGLHDRTELVKYAIRKGIVEA